jgi:paraquat-inducible protein B
LLAENLNRRVEPLADGLTNTVAQADQTLVQLRGSAEDLRGLLAPGSALQSELSLALSQLAEAARSLSSLAEFLEQHPNALITGRKSKETKP